jgi:hypothetical protein
VSVLGAGFMEPQRLNESRIKLRGAAAIKIDSFPFKRPPRHVSFMRWLGGVAAVPRTPLIFDFRYAEATG